MKKENETALLLPISAASPSGTAAKSNSVVIRSLSMGLCGIMIAGHIIANARILASMGSDAAAAASLSSSIHSFAMGTGIGFLLSSGVGLGNALGENDDLKAGNVTKMTWLMTALTGAVTSSIFLSARAWLHYVVNAQAAGIANEYFTYFAIAAPADLMIMSNTNVVFQLEKDWRFPLASTAAYRIPAIALAYFFGKTLNYGAMGVSLGAVISAWTTFLVSIFWFHRDNLQKFHLWDGELIDWKDRAHDFVRDGWKLSLQRITEWLNLAAIALLIGHWSENTLTAIQPSVQALTLFNMFSQGVAQAAMMVVARDKRAMTQYLKGIISATESVEQILNQKSHEIFSLHHANTQTFFRSNGAGVVLNTAFFALLYGFREQFCEFFLPVGVNNSTVSAAQTLLIINAASLVVDAIRIIASGVLRGWGDLLYPTLVSLITMTVIGIPASDAVSKTQHNAAACIFIGRIITIALSAIYSSARFYQHHCNDKQLLKKLSDSTTAADVPVAINATPGVFQPALPRDEKRELINAWLANQPGKKK